MIKKFILFITIFLFFSYPVGDADLGWHLRYGESFLKTGHVMRDNQFSWELPNYTWANHSWGFDIIAAALFGGERFWALSLSGGLVIATAIIILLPQTITIASIIAVSVFFYFGNELLGIGLRSQLFSLLFTAVLWKMIIENWKLKLVPLLFLIWSNIHGQFLYGLGILGLSLIPKWKKMPILFISAAATFINPFGIELWKTAISHFGAPELQYIYEWMPWEMNTPRMMLLLIYVALFWWGIYKTKPSAAMVLPLLTTTILALFSRRMIPYFLIMALPLSIHMLEPKLKKIPHIPPILPLTLLSLIALSLFFSRHLFSQSWDTYCNTNILCSEKAVEFMRANQIRGKIWNAYRIGGYLTYRYPEVKTMIDGRMTLWPDQSGKSPFMRYTTMVYLMPGSQALFTAGKYDYVLIQPQYPLAQTLLNNQKWPVIYQDEHLLLFKNPELAE